MFREKWYPSLMRLGAWLAQREGGRNVVSDDTKEVQLEDNYLAQNPETMNLRIKMVKIMEKGKMVARPFVVIWQATANNNGFTSESKPAELQELSYEDRAKIEVCKYKLFIRVISNMQWLCRCQGCPRVQGQWSFPHSSHGMIGSIRRDQTVIERERGRAYAR